MWTLEDDKEGLTNKVTIPLEGSIGIMKPPGVQVNAYVNGLPAGMHHLHVKTGDVVHFKVKSKTDKPESVGVKYGEEMSYITALPSASFSANSANLFKESEMTPMETVNLFANPNQGGMGGALGGGLGAGLVGGLLGNMLFRNGNLNGFNDGAGGVAPATLAGVESVVSNTAIMQTLGDIKASVPLAEAQVQLALAGVQSAIISDVTSQTNAIAATQSRDALAAANGFANVNTNVASTAAITQKAVADASLLAERNAWAVTQAINNDGDKTRALIQSIDKSNDSRTITNLANEVIELRGDRRIREATGDITISNTNTANAVQQQTQAQQQQQLQYQILAQLGILNNDIQSVKQSSVVFNSGTQTNSGNQAAANTRVA